MMRNSADAAAQMACGAARCEEVIAALEEAIRRQPADALRLYQLGLCYGGGCRAHSLTSPLMAAEYLKRALNQASAGGLLRASILDALGNTRIRCGDRQRDAALRDAIACHTEASGIYRAAGNFDDWARTQFNLGNSCCELSEATGEDHWGEAVSHYEKALEVRTRKRDPERYAAVLENLGTAYRRLPGTASAENVKKAIACYRLALRACPQATHPARNAALENNLGNAFLSMPATAGVAAGRNARLALWHFNHALRIQAAGKHECAYGITQYNRAQAYLRLAGSRGRNAEAALDCLEDAYAVFDQCGERRYAELAKKQLAQIGRGP